MDISISFAIVAAFVGLIVLALIGSAVYAVMRWIFAENDPATEKRKDEYFLDEIKGQILNINIKKD